MGKSTGDAEKNTRLLRAVLFLQLDNYVRQGGAEKQELLLARAGLGYQDIAELLGKKPDAVRMLLKRNQKSVKNL